MKEIKWHSKLGEEGRALGTDIWNAFMIDYGSEIAESDSSIQPGDRMRINWACKWNSTRNVGKEAIVLATNGTLCLVKISDSVDEYPVNMYRCEDLSTHEEYAYLHATQQLPFTAYI